MTVDGPASSGSTRRTRGAAGAPPASTPDRSPQTSEDETDPSPAATDAPDGTEDADSVRVAEDPEEGGEGGDLVESEGSSPGTGSPSGATGRGPLRTAHWELHPLSSDKVFVARRIDEKGQASSAEPPDEGATALPVAAGSNGFSPAVVSPGSTASTSPSSSPSAPAASTAGGAPNSPFPGPPPRADAREIIKLVQRNIGSVVIGYEGVVRALLVAVVAQGHILLEGVPGLAKTYLVRSFARSLALSFRRIQFTPDMLPADILGTVVLDPRTQMFEFRPGPIFAHVILADEINRAPPKVQSALLEAMQERQVTIEGVSYPLPSPFVVIATENPVELEGTYPLPEAELDRFLFRILLGYPSAENELKLLQQRTVTSDPNLSEGVLGAPTLQDLRAQSQAVYVHDDILRYLAAVLRETRNDPRVLAGASPRAGVQLLMAVKAGALFSGRNYATPDDVKDVMFDVLNHRLVLRPEVLALQASAGGKDDGGRALQSVVFSLLNKVAVPW